MAMAFAFWHLPLPTAALEAPQRAPCRTEVDFWRLPLPPLDLDDIDLLASPRKDVEAYSPQKAVASESTASPKEEVLSAGPDTPSDTGLIDREALLREGEEDSSGASSEPGPPRQRVIAAEISDMLTRCKAERFDFEQNLRELEEVQARLRALIVKAGEQEMRVTTKAGAARKEGDAVVEADLALDWSLPSLPLDVLNAILWCLDCDSLRRASSCCKEWGSNVEERWLRLLRADFGTTATSMQRSQGRKPAATALAEYRGRLRRFRAMLGTLQTLKGSGCPTGVTGSASRRRLFEALEMLAELGAVWESNAVYPSKVPGVLKSSEAWRTLLALLEDDSPHLQWLAVRCLADLAASPEAQEAAEGETCLRLQIREEVVRKGVLVRALLEGDDIDLVEAFSRLMLNLHGSKPGGPLGAAHRGPLAMLEASGCPLPSYGLETDKTRILDVATALHWAQAWSGLWIGEMCYARGGDAHAGLRLILGLQGDPQVDRATEALTAAAAEMDVSQQPSSSSSRRSGRAGGSAEYWRYFGFLADTDFDCETETVRYIEEQIRRRREPSSIAEVAANALCASSGKDLMLVGAGWNEQNGLFTAEAQLPKVPSSVTGGCGAVPLRLVLKFAHSWSTYELTAFLTDGCDAGGKLRRVPTLYGVWATTPSQHRHLFVLRRAGTLESLA